eukprot:m.39507 g.39507  ORF g.39507 m.39507 type:complete len:637 (+) comp10314_c0_seq2:84-1994(+)
MEAAIEWLSSEQGMLVLPFVFGAVLGYIVYQLVKAPAEVVQRYRPPPQFAKVQRTDPMFTVKQLQLLRDQIMSMPPQNRGRVLSRLNPATRARVVAFVNGKQDLGELSATNPAAARRIRMRYGGFTNPLLKLRRQDESSQVGWILLQGTVGLAISAAFAYAMNLAEYLPNNQAPPEEWMTTWAILSVSALVMIAAFKLTNMLTFTVKNPKAVIRPFLAVIAPSFERIDEAWDLVLSTGTISDHFRGLKHLVSCFFELMLLVFRLLTMVPYLYAETIVAIVFGSFTTVFYVGVTVAMFMELSGCPFPFRDVVGELEAESLINVLSIVPNSVVGVFLSGWASVINWLASNVCPPQVVFALYGHLLFLLGVQLVLWVVATGVLSLLGCVMCVALNLASPAAAASAFFPLCIMMPVILGLLISKRELSLSYRVTSLAIPIVAGTLIFALPHLNLLVLANAPLVALSSLSSFALPTFACNDPQLSAPFVSMARGMQDLCTSLQCNTLSTFQFRELEDTDPLAIRNCDSSFCASVYDNVIAIPLSFQACTSVVVALMFICYELFTWYIFSQYRSTVIKLVTAFAGAALLFGVDAWSYVLASTIFFYYFQTMVAEYLSLHLLGQLAEVSPSAGEGNGNKNRSS